MSAKAPLAVPKNWPDLVLVLLIVAGLGYTLYAGYAALQTPKEETALTTGVVTPAPTPDSKTTLNLNNSHQRQGQTVQVDPSKIGRDNPFNPPQ